MQVHAGRLQYFYNCWTNITSNKTILDWIQNGYVIPFFKNVHQRIAPRNTLTTVERRDMSIAIENLLQLGAICQCEPQPDQFISKIFLTPKPNGGKRFILNLKTLNNFITHTHFKMEDYRTACKLIPRNGFLATIDLKESYLLVPITPSQRKYLRFQFENESNEYLTYEFVAMPYGLSSAPRTFTKIMKEVVAHLRYRGYSSVIYLDDMLCIGRTYDECLSNVKETVNLMQCLGFIINFEKSNLQPSQQIKFLGFIYKTIDMSLSLPDNKREHILKLVKKYITLPRCTIKCFAGLIGVLISACPAVRYGWVYTKRLERQKFLQLKINKTYKAKINPSPVILPDLKWWSRNIMSTLNSLRPDKFRLEIFTDASRSGWGAFCNNERINGKWKSIELQFHINYLELLAVFFGLKCFARDIRNCSILLRIDNTTALSYINRMGGIQYPHLNNLTREIWQWCETRNLFLTASYIKSVDNKEADEESRRVNTDIELDLCDTAFNKIVKKLGKPDIDLFASRTNTKCPRYVSWRPDPDALAIDAFTLSWEGIFFYAFPPFSLILKCIEKIILDKAMGILVFPYWPSQPWFPLLQKVLSSNIIFINSKNNVSWSSSRNPQIKGVTLAAAKLSGTRF